MTELHPNAATTTLEEARRRYIDYKAKQKKQSTVRAYKTTSRQLVEYLKEQEGGSVIGEVTSYQVNNWVEERGQEVAPATVHNNAKHVRVFIGFCQRAGLVKQGTWEAIEVPELDDDDAISKEELHRDDAERLLAYLNKYHYASREHAQTLFMWHTGCRVSGSIAMDMEDWRRDKNPVVAEFTDRKATGTALKNGTSSERHVTILPEVADVINDYISGKREDVTDEYGRRPLFTTKNGRVKRQRMYKTLTKITRPCWYTGSCPIGYDMETCEAAQSVNKAFGCEASRSNHPVRRGSINYHLDIGWKPEKLSERVDVSVSVLNKHYDTRDHERKRAGREDLMDLF